MARFENILATIGKTPLVKLNNVTRDIKSTIYAKVEFFNPGGSVKDRIGLAMIAAAERDGLLKPGGTIIEATAGNTGVGLALVAALKNYRCIFVMPDKMSADKINLLKAYGAEVVITPTSVPPDSPVSYNGVADRLAKEIPGAYRPNQFVNPNNPLAHYETTGPEIWQDSEGKLDAFVAGMGTGGTISGTAKYLKEKNPNIIIIGADPEGSILSGDSPHSYKVEGIGEDFIPKTFNRQMVDEMIRVSDKEAFNTARRLAREEGLLVGGSAGTAVAAALKYAQRFDSAKYIVVLLPDTGRNYLTKIFSDSWMQENGFWEDKMTEVTTLKDILAQRENVPLLIFVKSTDILSEAVTLMHKYNISQIPVIDDNIVIGSLHEAALMKLLHDGIDFTKQTISAIMGTPMPTMDESMNVTEAYRILLSGETAIIVTRNRVPFSIVTRTDLINFWVHQRRATL